MTRDDDWANPVVDEWGMPTSDDLPDDDTASDDLTGPQRAAVEHFRGPLLVLAGPGSGKTRVITRRIARLIERGVRPREILAITFTNKAAREMAERVQRLLPGKRVWVSTFHSFCARLLREHGAAVGLQPNFSIYDTSDQQQLIRQVLSDLNLDSTHFPAPKLGQRISQAKNELLTADQYKQRYGEGIGTHLEAVVAKVYPLYQKRLLEANAVDFDDLLVHVALLLAEHEELRAELDQRHRFILVDEYQDTNQAQYQIVAALSQIEPNLCATGDPDQSIYGWRGARIENILHFEKDFPDVAMIRLEDNFRSTPEILKTADTLIAHNVHRKQKRLVTQNANGEPVELRVYTDATHEAIGIANEIGAMVESGERQWRDFAIFYRVNALSRTLETALSRQRIPYQVAGGLAFYERAEVKDLLAYLRLIENPNDRVAFLRIVNTPTRGIGKSSLERLVRWADATGTTLLDAARSPGQVPSLPKKAATQLRAFAALIDELAELSASVGGGKGKEIEAAPDDEEPKHACGPVEAVLLTVLRRTGYARQFDDLSDEGDLQRKGNIDELVSSARLFDEQQAATEEGSSLGTFLETASLSQDIDSLDEAAGAVTLMTLHAAKGLEFPVVYIVAVEQNLIPHERSLREGDKRQLEEERRLLFVGITRAKQKLVLTQTQRRELHGKNLSTIPSDFLEELDVETVNCSGEADFDFADSFEDGFLDESFGDEDVADECDHLDESMSEEDDSGAEGTDEPGTKERATRRRSERSDGVKPKRSAWQTSSQVAQNKKTSSAKSLHLTTGAALEAGAKSSVDLPLGFSIGMQVRHPRYGLGTVIDLGGFARNRTVTVEFASPDHRQETFVVSKCPLQPVGLL